MQIESTEPPNRLEIFLTFLRLGLTSFGGPVAHLSYFRAEFVQKRRWLGESAYADLVALCQFLPGPASSQVGAALGMMRGGIPGALLAWTGFTLPSALMLALFGLGLGQLSAFGTGWLHGLKIVAVAVVAQAVFGMAKSLCPDWPRRVFAVIAATMMLSVPQLIFAQIAVILLGAMFGLVALRAPVRPEFTALPVQLSRRWGSAFLALYFLLLLSLPFVVGAGAALDLFSRFYRAGALVFGGGHVVLPLLQAEVVPNLVPNDLFLAGYGAAQAVPGPLFTFAAYLGAVAAGSLGAVLALVGIFLPGLLLIFGVMPFWEGWRRYRPVQAAMRGVNASVVGILLAAFYTPICTTAIVRPLDAIIAAAGFAALVFGKAPPWMVVLLGAGLGVVLTP